MRRADVWIFAVVLLIASLFASASRAQQQPGQQASAPERPLDLRIQKPQSKSNSQDEDAGAEIAPDTHSLGGAFDFSLGTIEKSRSYWQPLFNVTSIIDSNPLTSGQTNQITSWTALYGGIDIRRKTHQSDMILGYVGGGLLDDGHSKNDSVIQQLEFGQKIGWGRSAISFYDLFDQLPETSFGFSLPLTLSLPAGPDLLLQPVFAPNQSILTTRGERIGNASVAEFDQALTRKTSLTFVGAYSLLRFLDTPNTFDYGEGNVQAGLDHQLNRRSTVGMLYRFSAIRFKNFAEPIDAHVVQLSYGQRIAGHLALRLAAGPGISVYEAFRSNPSSPGTATPATQSTSHFFWTADAAVTYQQRHTVYGLEYDRSLSGGGGALPGAITDQATGSVTTEFSRALSGGVTGGYARNRALDFAFLPPSTVGQVYDYWFAGVNLTHPWGRWTSLNVSYQAQYQSSNNNFCIGTACQKTFLRQTGSIGFTWHARPVPVQ